MIPKVKKFTCEYCGAQTTRNNTVRHKKSCSTATLYCTHCPYFFTKSQNGLKYNIAKKHRAPKPEITIKGTLCSQEFPRFYALRQHRNTQRGVQIESRTKDVDVEHIVRDVEDHKLREELCSCQSFLVDCEPERARHIIFIHDLENLNAKNVDEKRSFLQQLKNCGESESSFWIHFEK